MTTMTTPPQFTASQITAAIRSGIGNSRTNARLSTRRAAERSAAHRSILVRYRQHARHSFDDGDYRQAAEKSWDAYAQTVKAIGADHRLRIAHHAGIVAVASRLASLVRESDATAGSALRYGLAMARSLHQHFYENDLPDDEVIEAAADVAIAIDLMQRLFPAEPPA